jgi:hypothetical protein
MRTIKPMEYQLQKWDYKRWDQYNIPLQGSHSVHMWAQALTHLEAIYKEIPFKTLADVGCGFPPLDLDKIPTFNGIQNIIRADGSSMVANSLPGCRVSNFNKDPLPFQDEEVEFAMSFEVIEHMFSTFGFLSELYRISKYGFLISKPNTDFDGIDSHWYGEKYFFATSTPLFDGDIRFEHINFIPNYELFGFGRVLNCDVICLDQPDEEMQFFLFTKKEYFN